VQKKVSNHVKTSPSKMAFGGSPMSLGGAYSSGQILIIFTPTLLSYIFS